MPTEYRTGLLAVLRVAVITACGLLIVRMLLLFGVDGLETLWRALAERVIVRWY